MFEVPENPRVRFAPSPTGFLHIGGARTALFNWLIAKHYGGKFILRIEDTDEMRSSLESTGGILDGLKWLGLDWDEGPEIGGPHEPYMQSQRTDLYLKYARRLVEAGNAYYDLKTEPPKPGEPPAPQVNVDRRAYDPESRAATPESQLELFDGGAPHPLRIKCPLGEAVFEDAVRGEVRVDLDEVGDIIILKRNRSPVYNFSVTMDDAEMGIDLVLRGEDHISNTPKQLVIYELLDLAPPGFAHVPLILGQDKKRLSKRHGATDVLEYRDLGYLPDALVNFLALIGWNPGDDTEIMGREELVQKFSIKGLGQSSGIYNQSKLENFQGIHVRLVSPDNIAKLLKSHLPAEYFRDEVRFLSVVRLLHDRIVRFSEAGELMHYFFEEPRYSEKAVKKFLKENPDGERLFPRVLDVLEGCEPFKPALLEERFRELSDEFGVGLGKLLQPVRVAVTGDKFSPGMFETLEVVGKKLSVERFKRFVRGGSG